MRRSGRPSLVSRLRWIALGAAVALGAPTAYAQSRLAVLAEPDAVSVGIAVVLNSGTPWELESEAGLTPLAALAAIEQVRTQLDALGGRVRVECRAAATVLTLHLPAATWRLGALLFQDALFEQRVSGDAVERARAELLRVLEGQDPFTSEVRAALARALFGDGHRWARPPCGTAEAIRTLTEADVQRIRRSRFRPERATAAIAGPVTETDAREVLSGFASGDRLPLLIPAPTPGAGAGRVHVANATVTTWVTLAFPFEQDADLEALRLLAFHVRETLAPAPARPDVIDASTSIERHGNGGWLAVSLVTLPGSAAAREEEVRDLIRRSANQTLADAPFDALIRRYRGARLMELAAPEARALDAALDLFFERHVQPPNSRIDNLTPGRLRRAAAALGSPASASLGPL